MGAIRELMRIEKSGSKLLRSTLVGTTSLWPSSQTTNAISSSVVSGRRWSSNISGDLKGGEADVAIIGGGIVGLATAREITMRFPQAKVVVVEKENDLVKHQTSHNRWGSSLSSALGIFAALTKFFFIKLGQWCLHHFLQLETVGNDQERPYRSDSCFLGISGHV